MIFLIVLSLATTGGGAVLWLRRRSDARSAARVGMAIAMALAGVFHLVMPLPFVQHLPTWVPAREELVIVSGLAEIGLGAGLLLATRWRRRAGQLLAAYLVAVLPANVYVAVAGVEVDGQPGGIYPWLRLPLQIVFIAWALWSTREPSRTSGRSEARVELTSDAH